MTSPVQNPGSLTKDRLKAELRKANVTLPRKDSRKEVYVELYKTHLLSPHRYREFSSDDDLSPSPPSNKRRANTPKSKMSGKKSSGADVDITALSDADLADKLRSLGVDVGPILDSTRRVYQKKLQKLLAESVRVEASAPTVPVDELEFSDRDETPSTPFRQTRITGGSTFEKQDVRRRQVGPPTPSKPSTPSKSQKRTSPGRNTRTSRHVEPEPEPEEEEEEEEEEDMDFGDEETYEEEVDETMEEDMVDSRGEYNYRTATRDYANSVTTQAKPPDTQTKKKRSHSIWLQLGILLIVGIIIFLIIHNMEPANKSPIGKLASEV